jgi:hypothetical protein
MSQITYSNLFSEARNSIVSLISSSSNVPDPCVASSEFRKWIYAREPDVKATDFSGYPFIIIHPSDVEIGDKGSLDGKSKSTSWNMEIEIVASDRGYGNKNGMGLTHIDNISNNVIKTLLSETNKKTLRGYGLYFTKPVSTPVTNDIVANELVFRRSIMVSYNTRMQVSA